MTQRATIENYAQAVRLVKEMNIDYHQWKENDWKEEGRKAVKQVIEERMKARQEAAQEYLPINGRG